MKTDHLLKKLQDQFEALQSIVEHYSKDNDNLKMLISCLEEENQTLTNKLMREETRSYQLRKTIWLLKEKVHCICDGVMDHHKSCPLFEE